MKNEIQLFESNQVRTVWNEEEEQWYFSVVDVIEVLAGTDRGRKYWSDLKAKLKKEGSELSEKIGQLKSICYLRVSDLSKRFPNTILFN